MPSPRTLGAARVGAPAATISTLALVWSDLLRILVMVMYIVVLAIAALSLAALPALLISSFLAREGGWLHRRRARTES